MASSGKWCEVLLFGCGCSETTILEIGNYWMTLCIRRRACANSWSCRTCGVTPLLANLSPSTSRLFLRSRIVAWAKWDLLVAQCSIEGKHWSTKSQPPFDYSYSRIHSPTATWDMWNSARLLPRTRWVDVALEAEIKLERTIWCRCPCHHLSLTASSRFASLSSIQWWNEWEVSQSV